MSLAFELYSESTQYFYKIFQLLYLTYLGLRRGLYVRITTVVKWEGAKPVT